MRRWIRSLCLALLLAATTLRALAADELAASLSVKPRLCIADRVTGSCSASFEIRWQAANLGDYCIANDLQQLPLRCWLRAQVGEHVDPRSVRTSYKYWLGDPSQLRRYAEIKIEVLQLESADRRRERRSRHVWDVL